MSIRGGPGRLLRSSRADGRCVSGRCVSGRCEPGAVRFNFLEAQTVTYRPTALKQYDLEVGRVAVTSVPPGGPEAQTQMSSMRAARPILPWANLRRRLSVPNPETAGSGSPACEIWACWRLRGVARKDSPVRPVPSELPRRRDHCKTHSHDRERVLVSQPISDGGLSQDRRRCNTAADSRLFEGDPASRRTPGTSVEPRPQPLRVRARCRRREKSRRRNAMACGICV